MFLWSINLQKGVQSNHQDKTKLKFNITTYPQESLKLKRQMIPGVGRSAEQPGSSVTVCESVNWYIRFEKLFGSIY